jgi:hypothetical protein
MDVSASTALVPYQGIVMPLLAVEKKGVGTFLHRDQTGAGMRFLGYGMMKGGVFYGSSGRWVGEPPENGRRVDLYV